MDNILKMIKDSLKNKKSYIPNLLTLSRLAGAFIIPGLFLTGNILPSVISAALFASTDFIDGRIARKYNGTSDLGKALDPVVDKVFVIVPSLAILPFAPVIAFNIAAEGIIAYINTKSYTKGKKVKSSFLGKFKTFFIFPAIVLCYMQAALNLPTLTILTNIFCASTFAIQCATAYDYHKKSKINSNDLKEEDKIFIQKEEEKQEKLKKNLTAREMIDMLKEEKNCLLEHKNHSNENIDINEKTNIDNKQDEKPKQKILKKSEN